MAKHLTEHCMVLSVKTYDWIADVKDFEMQIEQFNQSNKGLIRIDTVKVTQVDPVDVEVYKDD